MEVPPEAGSARGEELPSVRATRPAPAPARPASKTDPLGRERYKVQFTAGRRVYEKLQEAQALLRHAVPDGNLEEIFENREQIEISKFYEKLPKPSSIAVQEMFEDKIYFRRPEVEVEVEKDKEKEKEARGA